MNVLPVDVNEVVADLDEGVPADLGLNAKIMKVSNSNDGLTAVTHTTKVTLMIKVCCILLMS